MERGVFLAYTNCTDPARHEEYNRWYSHTHLGDLSAAKGFARATRYTQARKQDGAPQYLAVYEFESESLEESVNDLRRIARGTFPVGRHIDCLEAAGLYTYYRLDPADFQPIEKVNNGPVRNDNILGWERGVPLAAALRKAVLLVMTDCTDASREDEYNRWYFHMHIPDLLAADGLHRAARYRVGPSGESSPKYLAVYEFESADPWLSLHDMFRTASASFETRQIDCMKGSGPGGFWLEVDAAAYQPLETLAYPGRMR